MPLPSPPRANMCVQDTSLVTLAATVQGAFSVTIPCRLGGQTLVFSVAFQHQVLHSLVLDPLSVPATQLYVFPKAQFLSFSQVKSYFFQSQIHSHKQPCKLASMHRREAARMTVSGKVTFVAAEDAFLIVSKGSGHVSRHLHT